MKADKRVFGRVEAVFNILYLLAATAIGLWLLGRGQGPVHRLGAAIALLLAAGDAFHLVPRIAAILTGDEVKWARAMGIGKLVTSLTMTGCYLLLWQLGLQLFESGPAQGGWHRWTLPIYLLAALRVLLCLLPQNGWLDRHPPVRWGIIRNLPFLLLGLLVAALFFAHAGQVRGAGSMGVAILLSFGFYLPVVLWANQKPMVGMLMLPKTCAYLWMLVLCLSF